MDTDVMSTFMSVSQFLALFIVSIMTQFIVIKTIYEREIEDSLIVINGLCFTFFIWITWLR